MSPRSGITTLLAVIVLSSAGVSAGTADSEPTRTEVRATEDAETPSARARHWELSAEEWRRYESIMEGPRGLWTPDLDPIWVLGIHADSARERRHYAERAVEQERRRVAGELAFQHAYDAAWDRLYPNRVLIEPSARTRPGAGPRISEPDVVRLDDLQDDDRVVLVAARDCDRCGEVLGRAVHRLQNGAGWRLDIFLTDTDADQEVRAWAAEHSIPVELVRDGRITLNHDDGTLAEHEAPSLFRRSGSRWQPVSPSP